jgi:uncharacterized oxidoreductase
MVVIHAPELRDRVFDILRALDCPEAVCSRVACSLVESNLVGHDSHGVMRVPAYATAIKAGTLKPHSPIRVVKQTASTALLNCGHNFGHVGAAEGMEIAVAKATHHDIALVVLQACGHTGRLGEYVVAAAEQGFMGMIFCNGSLPGGIVAPFGGTGRALGSNPLAWGVPGGDGKPVFLDFATSVVAQGKIQVAADKGETIPPGWLLDKDGRATRDPREQFDGGVMLPFGGHKGYALGALIDLAAGGISGAGNPLQPDYSWSQGTLLVAVRIEAFQPIEDFERMVADYAIRLKATRRAPDCEEILLPGEPEWRCKEVRGKTGIPVPDKTWGRLRETALALGVEWD